MMRFQERCKKVKQFHYRPEQAQRMDRGIALLFCDLSTRRVWPHALAALTSGKT
jgi:hypothetical protein